MCSVGAHTSQKHSLSPLDTRCGALTPSCSRTCVIRSRLNKKSKIKTSIIPSHLFFPLYWLSRRGACMCANCGSLCSRTESDVTPAGVCGRFFPGRTLRQTLSTAAERIMGRACPNVAFTEKVGCSLSLSFGLTGNSRRSSSRFLFPTEAPREA